MTATLTGETLEDGMPATTATFAAIADRDAFLERAYTDRIATDTPGVYRLPNRGGYLHVLLERVTFEPACMCSYGASGSHTIPCLNRANARLDAFDEAIAQVEADSSPQEVV